MERVGIAVPASNRSVSQLSGGQRQAVAIGRAVAWARKVIILDEPTNHLDMEAIEELNKALKAFDGTLIFVSHDREFVSSLATRVVEIKDNKIIYFQGTYDEYLAHQR